MEVVQEHFDREDAGWLLEDTSSRHPWDFEASRPDELIRIEVKGTTGAGTHVLLTAGEIGSTTTHTDSALAVVSDIRLDTSGETPSADGGRLRLIRPWSVEPARLRPLTYEYRVPEDPVYEADGSASGPE
jgi:hypothetical protein